jgi:hypothetical protein
MFFTIPIATRLEATGLPRLRLPLTESQPRRLLLCGLVFCIEKLDLSRVSPRRDFARPRPESPRGVRESGAIVFVMTRGTYIFKYLMPRVITDDLHAYYLIRA